MRPFIRPLALVFLFVCLAKSHAQKVLHPEESHYKQKKERSKEGAAKAPIRTMRPTSKPVYPKEMKKEARRRVAEKYQVHSPVLVDQSLTLSATNDVPATKTSTISTTSTAVACNITSPEADASFSVLSANDDASLAVSLPFTFNFFGVNYQSVYVNNNGNITLDAPLETYTSTGFPNGFDMVAPFWADVDTRNPASGLVYYKTEATRLTVIWYNVGYYDEKVDKQNTFKVILTDGTDPIIGAGNNIGFFYEDMQWTSGDASGGSDGLGGSPATVGVNNGQAADACFFYQIGSFGKAGSEFINPFVTGGVDYLDNQCFFFDVSTREDLTMDFTASEYLCAVKFRPVITNPQNCQVYFYQWDFGDGNLSYETEPIHTYAGGGDYTATLSIYYACGACTGNFISTQQTVSISGNSDLLSDTLIEVATEQKTRVLSANAATFSDVWPMRHLNSDLSERHSYANGSQGTWRKEGDYVYNVPRQLSSSIDLSEDGSFDLDLFNWEYAALDAIPNWIHSNRMTRYSPYSYEIENQNVLGVYNAALYDYGGHLPSANGYNMKQEEMAFTSFEYLLEGEPSGNWIFGLDPLPSYYEYPVIIGYSHIALVEAPPESFDLVTEVDVSSRSYFSLQSSTIRDNPILCVRPVTSNPGWSLIVFDREPSQYLWIGSVRINNQVVPKETPDVENVVAHAGANSLKITQEQAFEQPLIRMDSASEYLISVWVSVNNPYVTTPYLANDLGVDITLKDANDQVVLTDSFTPSGVVIEGWQRLEGVFTCPEDGLVMTVNFKPGDTGTAWYDDLRFHPNDGNMMSYVYNLDDYRLQATIDEENFGSFYYYDTEGNLYLTKKETIDGIKTLQENMSYQVER